MKIETLDDLSVFNLKGLASIAITIAAEAAGKTRYDFNEGTVVRWELIDAINRITSNPYTPRQEQA